MLEVNYDHQTWINEIYTWIKRERLDMAVDILFDNIDGLMHDCLFGEINKVLEIIDIKRLDENLIISLFAITYTYRDRLPQRSILFKQAKEHFKIEFKDILNSLEGLE